LQEYNKFKAESDSLFNAYSNKNVKIICHQKQFTKHYFKTLLEKPTHFLTDQVIAVGTTWISTDEMNLLDEMLEVEIENKVLEYTNGICLCKQEAELIKI
jgi:hypothetical protein